ncbi:MAG TPA: Hsp20/alpha crystallin family protein [Thermohalobaculum sp.]|nr:Hsp20/alpha crystallin family protein [Thermohalobaculum sp.]
MIEKTTSPAWWPGFFEPFRNIGDRVADWFAPRAEAKASNAHYEITMELPGVEKDDIDIALHDGVLTVKGEKHSERKEEGEGYFFSEREYGRFQRTFRLPGDVKDDEVSADFSNGVLKIRVPKRAEEKQQAKKIKVSAG